MKKILIITLMLVATTLPLTSAQAYSYAGYRWGGTYPTVGLDTRAMNLYAWRAAATDAMNDWNATGSRWTIVNYSPSNNTIGVYYDSGSRTLAYTRTYRTGGFYGNVYRGTVMVNNAKSFNPPFGGCSYDLRTILRHELGHFLVLNHEDRFWTLMNTEIDCAVVIPVTSDERTAIRSIYGIR